MRFQLKMPISPFQPLPLAKDALWSLAPFGMAGVAVDVDAGEMDFRQDGLAHMPRREHVLPTGYRDRCVSDGRGRLACVAKTFGLIEGDFQCFVGLELQ